MLKFRLKKWQLVLGLALAVVLIGILALSVVAQDGPGGGETGAVPNKFSEVDEEETSARELTRASNFLFVSANGFVPFDDSMEYEYYGAGCVYRTAGDTYSEYSLQLPQGLRLISSGSSSMTIMIVTM